MDNVVGAAQIVITPNTALFEGELEAKTAAPLAGMGRKAEKAGTEAGQKLSKGFGRELGGVASSLAGLGVPLRTFNGRLTETAGEIAAVEKGSSKLTTTIAALGGKALLGTAAGFVAVGAAGVDLAVKQEKVTTTIANSAHISEDAAKQITNAFLNTVDVGEYSGNALSVAYAPVAGVLGELQGHALESGEALKFMTAAEDLSTGAQIELGNATSDLAKTLQAYHIGVDGAAGASDVLYNTARLTGIEVDQLATVLGRVKGKLGDLAPSLGESGGLLAALAQHSVAGLQATRALGSSLNTLVGGGKATTDMAKALGLQIFDSQGRFVGLRSVIEQLQPKLAGLSQDTQLQATKALLGGQANKQLLSIILEGPSAFDKHTKAVSRSGAAHEAAAGQAKTFQGEVKRLEKEAENLATKFGDKLLPVLAKVAGALADGIKWLIKHKGAAESLAIVIGTVLGGAISLFVAVKVKAFVDGIRGMMTTLGLLSTKTATTAAEMAGSEATMVSETEAAAGSIGTSTGAMEASFGATAAAATSASAEVGTAVGGEAAAVEAADASIVAANEAAGLSFTAMLGPIAAVVAALIAAQPLINELTGGGLGETGAEGQKAGSAGTKGLKTKSSGPHGGVTYYEAPQGESVEKTIFDFFTKAGFTSAGSAGILGNFTQESSLRSTLDSKEGFGLASWTNERKSELAAYAKSVGLPATAITAQLNFVLKELNSRPELKSALQHTTDPKKAAELFNAKFEGGTDPQGKREKFAAEALSRNAGHHAAATQKDTAALGRHNAALEKSIAGLGAHTKTVTAHGKKLAVPSSPLHKGNVGFFAAAGTDYTKGEEPIIARYLGKLGESLHLHLTGISGYRSPSHSVAVGGFRNDPHTRGEASDTPGTEKISEKMLEKFGLTRPFAGAKEADHIQLSAKGLEEAAAAVKKGGSGLSAAGANLVLKAAAELAKRSADKKTGESQYHKIDAAIQSGGVKELTKVVGNTHERTMKQLERDHHSSLGKLLLTLHHDHTGALDKLAAKLVKVHEKALEALNKALLKQHEKSESDRLSKEDRINTDAADAAATAIGDSTRVALDHAAEAGKAAAELIAAQAQTHLDEVKSADDAGVAAAKIALDRAQGTGELNEALAQAALTAAENTAKTNEAQAQSTLDLANNAAQEAQKTAEAAAKAAETKQQEQEARERTEREAKEAQGTTGGVPGGPAGNFTFYINGANLSAPEVMAEIGWALKTGTLPVAPPTPAHAVAA